MTGPGLRLVTEDVVANPLQATMTTWNDGRHRRQEIAPNTYRAAQVHIRSLADHFGAGVPVPDVTEAGIEAWLAGLTHLAPRSRRTYLGTARGFFKWAHRRGLIEVDPMTHIKGPRLAKPLPRRLAPKDVELILAHAPFRARVLIVLAVGLGLRRSELAALRVEDFDPTKGTLLVNGKGSKQRVVPVAGEPAVALTAWLADGRRSGPMFPSRQGAGPRQRGKPREPVPLSSGRIAQDMVDAAAYVGLTVTPHQYRHTCAYETLEAGASIEVVRRLLGHTDISTTGRYLHAMVDDIRPHVGQRTYYRGRWGVMTADDVPPAVPDFS